MAGSTISSKVTIGVTLGMTTGGGTYASPLTITHPGYIAPTAYGATALYAAASGGYVLNKGTISGGVGNYGEPGTGGIAVALISGSLTNFGSISGGAGGIGAGGIGIDLATGSAMNFGEITGGVGGSGISGGSAGSAGGVGGIGVYLSSGSLINSGMILGGTGGSGGGGLSTGGAGGAGGAGVVVMAGAVTNYGTIFGGRVGYGGFGSGGTPAAVGVAGIGVFFTGGGTLTNAGQIKGNFGANGRADSVYFGGGPSRLVVSGVLLGPAVFSSGGTMVDAGYVSSGYRADAVYFGSGASRLILSSGAHLKGGVVAQSSFANALELSGNGGVLRNIGAAYVGFGTITFDPGSTWLISGNAAGIASGQTISGFTHGDTIDLTGFVATSHTFTGSGLVLNGASTATVGITGSFSTSDFVVSNFAGYTTIQLACFAAGTRIATDGGETPVEALRVGDIVRVAPHSSPYPLLSPEEGREERGMGVAGRSVVWIGHRTIDCGRHPVPQQVWPVRIRAGAFADVVPRRDLYLSPDHAVLIDRVLIPIRYLINGGSIAQVPMDRVTYIHVELARHDVLLAEGLPAESYLDRGDRALFANADVVRLFGGFGPADACTTWEAGGCAPLVITGPLVEAARAALDKGEPDARDSTRRRRRSVA